MPTPPPLPINEQLAAPPKKKPGRKKKAVPPKAPITRTETEVIVCFD